MDTNYKMSGLEIFQMSNWKFLTAPRGN